MFHDPFLGPWAIKKAKAAIASDILVSITIGFYKGLCSMITFPPILQINLQIAYQQVKTDIKDFST